MAQAQAFQALGFEWLHIVDLDGAFSGKPENARQVKAVLDAVSLPIQFGWRDQKSRTRSLAGSISESAGDSRYRRRARS